MLATNKKYIRVFSLILVSIFILTNTTVYAQTFTDVPDKHWAKEYIDKMNNAGIIKGEGEKFNPSGNVTRTEAVVMISRLLSVDKDKTSQARQTYQSFLTEMGIKEWFQDGIAIALASGIVSKDAVKTFRTNNKDNPAQKDELCIYLTRAMGLEKEAAGKTFIVLPFKDSELIPAYVAPYIDMMINKGVVSSKGDENGKFNPKASVNRAMMAKMLSIAYDNMKSNGTSVTVPDTSVPDKNEKTISISGTISSIVRATNEIYITIEDKRGTKTSYRANSTSTIKLDGKKVDFKEIVEGLKVGAEVTEDFRIVSLEAEGINEDYEGTIKSITSTSPAMLTIEYKIDDKSSKTERKTFYMDEDADIIIDGEDAYLRELKSGDLVKIKVKNSKIVDIEAQSKYLKLEGTVKDIKYSPEPELVIVDEYKETYEFPVDNRARIERNRRRAQISDIRKGDKVNIEVEYNIITDIEAKTVKSEDEGSIVGILISSKPELTIRNKDGETNTYYIGNMADIDVDRRDADIYGLKLGYYVEVDIEGDEIVSLEAEAREKNDRYTGIVDYVNSKAEVVVISVIDPNSGEKKQITVYVTDDTSYIDADGGKTRFSYIDKGDEIFVMGSFDGTIFTAKSVIITQDNN